MRRKCRKVAGWRKGQPAKCQLNGSEKLLLTASQIRAAVAAWSNGDSQSEIAMALGVSVDTFRARLRDQLAGLGRRGRGRGGRRRGTDPTEEEIYGRLTMIEQANWSEEDRDSRWVGMR